MNRRCLLAFAVSLLWVTCLAAQAPTSKPVSTNDWPLETLRLKDGRTLRGLLQLQREGVVEFIEIVRPQGKPMYAILHPVMQKEVESLMLLPPSEHDTLARRFEQFRHRAMIEAGRMQDLVLTDELRDGRHMRVYHGPWFTLMSTADDEITRRCVVRIEQTFRAYRLLLEPRVAERRNLQVLLWGSMDEYRGYLRSERLDIANPAYYSVKLNQIVAGSDLSQYAVELAKARTQNQQVQQEFALLSSDMPKRLQLLAEEMKAKGFSREEIRDEQKARRTHWALEVKQAEKQIAEMSRRNDARFAEVTREMFRRLSHEAFHAYVENYVYPHDQGELPRWLNEGLAMIFESGQLEADALRVDAPHAELLARLQADLASSQPLPLARLLAADAPSFVKAHDLDAANRNYLYAWGLAYVLTFDHDLLRSERLAAYAASSDTIDRITPFEKLVDQPLAKFEPQWRAAIMKLKAPK